MEFITFGRFGRKENWVKDRELFLNYKKKLIYNLSCDYYQSLDNKNEIEINELLKKNIKEKKLCPNFDYSLMLFMNNMGLSYNLLKKEEKEEIIEMDFTFENWERKSKIFFDNFKENSKKVSPPEVQLCFEDKCFIIFVQIFKNCEISKNNIIKFIRDYFILDIKKNIFERLRDPILFNTIRNNMIDLYPKLKAMYGINKNIEKLLSYFEKDNDYNNKYIKRILEKYDNKDNKANDDEKIIFKDKID